MLFVYTNVFFYMLSQIKVCSTFIPSQNILLTNPRVLKVTNKFLENKLSWRILIDPCLIPLYLNGPPPYGEVSWDCFKLIAPILPRPMNHRIFACGGANNLRTNV